MISIVVPTLGRPSLARLLASLAEQLTPQLTARPTTQLTERIVAPPATGDRTSGPGGGRTHRDRPAVEILLVDDRPTGAGTLPVPAALGGNLAVLPGRAAGPAAARNVGWRAARHPWVVFLDDDVVPAPDWWDQLRADLAVPAEVGGVQGRIRVPLPVDRRPTDWERATAGLADGQWITADMAYRRVALATVGGFDERFPRAYREDAELAHRVRLAGWRLVRGDRTVTHPVRAESRWVSLRTQRGNADDALLRRCYGARWRAELDLPPGRRRRHAVITAAALVTVTAAGIGLVTVTAAGIGLAAAGDRRITPDVRAHRRWRQALTATAVTAAGGWLVGTGQFAWERIAPGPRDPAEVGTMLVTSALIPPLAVGHWLRGWWRHRRSHRLPSTAPGRAPDGIPVAGDTPDPAGTPDLAGTLDPHGAPTPGGVLDPGEAPDRRATTTTAVAAARHGSGHAPHEGQLLEGRR